MRQLLHGRWVSFFQKLVEGLLGMVATSLVAQFFVAGVLFAFIFPPLQTPDENSHFNAGMLSYTKLTQSSSHEFCGHNASLLESFYSKGYPIGSEPFKAQNLRPKCVKTVTYGWLFNYPAVLIAAAFTTDKAQYLDQVLFRVYLARILNGLFTCYILFRAICLIRDYGYRSGLLILLSFCISPLFLQQSWSITADIPLNLFAIALALTIIYFPYLKRLDLWVFSILSVIACSSKPLLVPVIPFALFFAHGIHSENAHWSKIFLRSVLKHQFFRVLLIAMLVGVFFVFFQIGVEKDKGTTDISNKLAFVLEHPWEVFGYLNECVAGFFSRAQHFYFTPLGYFKVKIPRYILELYLYFYWTILSLEAVYLAFVVAMNFDVILERLKNRPRLVYLATFAGLSIFGLYISVLLPVLSMYLTWTPLGATNVQGVQIRYFYPMIFCGIGLVSGSVIDLTGQKYDEISTPRLIENGKGLFVATFFLFMMSYWATLYREIFVTYFKS